MPQIAGPNGAKHIAPMDDDEDDDEGWEDMPIVRDEDLGLALDEEDQKKYHYVTPKPQGRANYISAGATGNATGDLVNYDIHGNEWRSKQTLNENDYTRLQLNDDDVADEVHLRTQYLFDEDKAMTPLSQMQQTKKLLTEAQRIAYVGLCYLTCQKMSGSYSIVRTKELLEATKSLDLWALKIMGRLYYHMDLETQEQKMIESLSQHGVSPDDLVPSLMTTHTVANPEYDPSEKVQITVEEDTEVEVLNETIGGTQSAPNTPGGEQPIFQTTANVLQPTLPVAMPGVSTSLSASDKEVTLDIRWTILCDLFLLLVADSVYDARSRVLLETVAASLGLGWLDVVRFEKRVTDALEIQENVERLEQQDVIDGRAKSARKRRFVMMGLATLGGGLVIGLSAGLLAPVIGAGLGAALTTVGVTGTTTFLAGAGGAAVITTGGVITGSSIAGKGMARRTRDVGTFNLLPMHNHKRVNCIVTVPGFMNGAGDDVRLPFSVLDPVVGDVFSVLWEPEMMGETGNALKILTTEVVTQLGQTVLQATVMTALMSALQWPIILTKLGYLIDNPWSNALDRAKSAGLVLADVLAQRSLGVRPITIIGFSLGARVIFYALLELAKKKMHGIVQDVFLLGATVTVSTKTWHQARSVVAGRFVNGYARNDWILNYLFRASSGGLNTIAGLRPVENVPGLENVDVTDKIAGHMSYRVYMPLILEQLGFPVTADYFNEPEEMKLDEDYEERPEGRRSKFNIFSRNKNKGESSPAKTGPRPPSTTSFVTHDIKRKSSDVADPDDEGEPPREENDSIPPPYSVRSGDPAPVVPLHAGFDFTAIQTVLEQEGTAAQHSQAVVAPVAAPAQTVFDETNQPQRSESAPIGTSGPSEASSSRLRTSFDASLSEREEVLEHSASSYRASDDATQLNSRLPPAPSISFGGSDGAIWVSEPETQRRESDVSSGLATSAGSVGEGMQSESANDALSWRLPRIAAKKSSLLSNPWES